MRDGEEGTSDPTSFDGTTLDEIRLRVHRSLTLFGVDGRSLTPEVRFSYTPWLRMVVVTHSNPRLERDQFISSIDVGSTVQLTSEGFLIRSWWVDGVWVWGLGHFDII